MQLTKPKVKRTHVTATDGDTRKSRGFTIYNATPDEFLEQVKRVFGNDAHVRRSRRQSQTAGA